MLHDDISRREFIQRSASAALLAGVPLLGGGCSRDSASDVAVSILIIGGGSAGISVAARLRRRLKRAAITLVDPAEKHFYQPGFTFVGAGVWQPNDIWMPQSDLIPKGVAWIRDTVEAVEADHKVAVLASGKKLTYDFLVLCPGLQENWSLVEGIKKESLGAGNAHSIYDFEGASKTWKAIDEFTQKGGKGLFTDTWTKLKCGGAPKKICLLSEHLARKRATRASCRFQYYTASKELYDVPHFTPRLQEIYKERNVPISLNCRLTGVDTSAKKAHFLDTATGRAFAEEYDFLHFTPPQSAPDFVKKSGLGWTEGKLARESWVKTDKKTLVHIDHTNIICLGDAAGIPTSKTSAAIRKQAPIAVANLCSLIAGKEPAMEYNGYAACPIITDYGHVIMAEFDYEKKPDSSFPFTWMDTSRELRSAWWLKAYILKPMYFHLMLRGWM